MSEVVIKNEWTLIDPSGYPINKRGYIYTKEDVKFLSKHSKSLKESTILGKELSHLALCTKDGFNVTPLTDMRPAHFFDVYEGLNLDRDKEYSFLEIGNRWCGALWGWRVHLHNSKIYGLDIDKDTQLFSNNNPDIGIKVYEGDQTDIKLLQRIHNEAGKLDIVIDDGGHTMPQMKTSFETLWPLLEEGGIYVIEDTHCCYWTDYGGGYKVKNTFIEDVKSFLDNIHSPYYKLESLMSDQANHMIVNEPSNYYDKSIESVEVYDSIIVIKKRKNIKNYLETRSIEYNFVQECLNDMIGKLKEHEERGMAVGLTSKERDYYVKFWLDIDEKFCNYIEKKSKI